MNMSTFIAERIMEQADRSVEAGQNKYRAYFVKTKLYEKWRNDVETILITDGYEECIIAE
jgi:hypothetical protein